MAPRPNTGHRMQMRNEHASQIDAGRGERSVPTSDTDFADHPHRGGLGTSC